MDKRKQLYNLYKERGLISDAVSEDVFLSANELQQEQLYNLGKQYDLFESTDFGTFQSAWDPIKKKRGFGFTFRGRRYFVGYTRNGSSKAFGIFSRPSS